MLSESNKVDGASQYIEPEPFVIASASWAELIKSLKQRWGLAESLNVLNLLDAEQESVDMPATWHRLPVCQFLDMPRMCQDFMGFLEDWPQLSFGRPVSFDKQFRLVGNYSLWWTRVGSQRVPVANRGTYWTLRCLWIADKALKKIQPRKVFLSVADATLERLLFDRCRRAGIDCETMSGRAPNVVDPCQGRVGWMMKSLARLVVAPLKMLATCITAHWMTRRAASAFRPSTGPVVVCSSRLARYFELRNGRIAPVFWQSTCDALQQIEPILNIRYFVNKWRNFPGCESHSWWYSKGWTMVQRLEGILPIMQRYLALRDYAKALPAQVSALFRYARLEKTPPFRQSFRFADTDVSPLFVPVLREAVATMAQWAQVVGSIRESIRAAGDVRAMLVAEEFYETALDQIAAARQLGIPTIGVQHGTIHSTHLVYTIPAGHVEGAPTPDYFSAYGNYAKEIVCSLGAFPAERVWVTGGSRFDHLVNLPLDRAVARRELNLPIDRRIILFATQTFWWFPAAAKVLYELAREHKDWFVCVKKHPSIHTTKTDRYRQIAEEAGLDDVRFFEDHFAELLAACDVLISSSSTTILEAALMGRKAISINLSGEPDWYPYVEGGGALPARTVEELRKSLERCFSESDSEGDEQRRLRFLEEHAGPAASGAAAATLARKIVELCFDQPRNAGTERSRMTSEAMTV